MTDLVVARVSPSVLTFTGLPPQPVRLVSGVGGGGVGDSAPRNGLELLDASTGVVRRVGFSRSPDQEGMPKYGGMC